MFAHNFPETHLTVLPQNLHTIEELPASKCFLLSDA